MKTFLFWAAIVVLCFVGIYNCAIEMAEGNWPVNAMIAALVIFAAGVFLGVIITAPRRRVEIKRCRLVAVRDQGSLATAASWDAEIWCPICGDRHVDIGEYATKLHKAHRCDHCGLTWVPFPVATFGVRS